MGRKHSKKGMNLFWCLSVRLCLIFLFILLSSKTSWGREADLPQNASHIQHIEGLVNQCYQKFHDVPWITLEEFFQRKKSEDWILLDIRSKKEREVSIIPGALSKKEFKRTKEKHKAMHILVYCTVGCRSGAYTKKLLKEGFHAFNLWGGVLTWASSGRLFVTSDGTPTRKVHVYGRKWNALPPDYEAVW